MTPPAHHLREIAQRALDAWAAWAVTHDAGAEGWPPLSMTAVALERRLSASRQPPGPRVPRFRRHRVVDRTERLLQALPALERQAVALGALAPRGWTQRRVAEELDLGLRHYRRLRRRGLERLGAWLVMAPRT